MPRNATRGSFKKGDKRAGRPPGVPNKVTGEVKDMIVQALSESGGVEYLKKRAIDSPNAFLSLVGRVLPLQVTGKDGERLIPGSVIFVVQQQKDSENRT